MRSVFSNNVVIIALMGVLLLFASAVGRVAATNVGSWLSGMQLRASAAAPERISVATADWRTR